MTDPLPANPTLRDILRDIGGDHPFTAFVLDRSSEEVPYDLEPLLTAWLCEHGFDGLWADVGDDPCGCTLADFAPCSACSLECRAAYARPASDGDVRLWLDRPAPPA